MLKLSYNPYPLHHKGGMMTTVEKLIHDFVEAQPAAKRLYPDLWSKELADIIRKDTKVVSGSRSARVVRRLVRGN
jgi:hypothetical protein